MIMMFLFCVRESDGVVDVEDVDACAGSHLNRLSVSERLGLWGVTGRGDRQSSGRHF